MDEQDKQLLLEDLCARLPYDVYVHIRYKTGEPCYGKLTPRDIQWFIDSKIETIKPYLRPMSDMTAEEKNEWMRLGEDIDKYIVGHEAIVDFYNRNHFDYRGLIPKGLALKAKENMYK